MIGTTFTPKVNQPLISESKYNPFRAKWLLWAHAHFGAYTNHYRNEFNELPAELQQQAKSPHVIEP